MPNRRERKAKETDQSIEARGVDLSKEDEMLPEGAKPVGQPSREGNERDTAGSHGRMAPEAAKSLEEPKE